MFKMDLSLQHFLSQRIQSGHWAYATLFQTEQPLISLPRTECPIAIRDQDYYTTCALFRHRLGFPSEPAPISAEFQNQWITIQGTIVLIGRPIPVVEKYIMTCPLCHKAYPITNPVPLLTPDYTAFQCPSPQCAHNTTIPYAVQETFLDGVKVGIRTEEGDYLGYILAKPAPGFREVVAKAGLAAASHLPVRCQGFVRIGRQGDRYQYYFELIDLESTALPATPPSFLTFKAPVVPTSEQELVMSVFFVNLEFMQRLLGFTEYAIQQPYPDLRVYDANGGMRVMEFEFDVANFYAHGHHKAPEKCDLIIAWQNTSTRTEVPFLLLSQFADLFLPQ